MTADLTNVQWSYAEYFYKHLVQPLKMRGLIIYLAVLQCLWYKSRVVTQNMFRNNYVRSKTGAFQSFNMVNIICSNCTFLSPFYQHTSRP